MLFLLSGIENWEWPSHSILKRSKSCWLLPCKNFDLQDQTARLTLQRCLGPFSIGPFESRWGSAGLQAKWEWNLLYSFHVSIFEYKVTDVQFCVRSLKIVSSSKDQVFLGKNSILEICLQKKKKKKVGKNLGECMLCNHATKAVDHFFCNCAFFSTIWKAVCLLLGVLHPESNFKNLCLDRRQ